MVNSSTDKSLKNYLYDNPQLRESKTKKASVDIDLTSGDNEIWLLQCPKNFVPQELLCCQLGEQSTVECSADRFSETKTLAVIAPEKAAEYQMICDKLKLVKPVGKIVLSEKYGDDEDDIKSQPSKKRSKASEKSTSQRLERQSSGTSSCDMAENMNSQSDECDQSESETKSERESSKKFSIEARKKSDEKSLPLVPPKPSPLKKKKSSKRDDGCC